MRGIYLAACKARHPNYDIVYQDIDTKYKCDLNGDMLKTDISGYDFIIATPPCNYWSRANPYYKTSNYSAITRHLLPDTIEMLGCQKKPFIIENVINRKRMTEHGIFDIIEKYKLYVYYIGRHMYISNIFTPDILGVPQIQDFKYGGIRVNKDGYNQGGTNVHNVIEKWLEIIKEVI